LLVVAGADHRAEAQAPPAQTVTKPQAFVTDDRAMEAMEWHIGEWEPPSGDPLHGQVSMAMTWTFPKKAVRIAEYRVIDGVRTQIVDGVAGYHYGLQRIEMVWFVRDGVNPFEVMNTGSIETRPGRVLIRTFRSYDPDTSSREYRETFSPIGQDERSLTIEFKDDEGAWKLWREYR
jgi:hypothetical protein